MSRRFLIACWLLCGLIACLAAGAARGDILEKLDPQREVDLGREVVVIGAGGVGALFVEREGLVENARVVGEYLQERLAETYAYPMVGDVRGLGLVACVELV